MYTDFVLSALHFMLAFLLVAILAVQWALIRSGMTARDVKLAAIWDRMYGASAVLLLGAGFGRVFFGAKGSPFYLSNPVFWAKIGFFAAVALLSIPVTVQLIRWFRHVRTHPQFQPADDRVREIRRWLMLETMVLAFIPVFAAAMARGYGIG